MSQGSDYAPDFGYILQVQKFSARFNVIQSFVLTIPTFITCLYYGALSDKIGRKPIFLVSVVGGILDSVLTLLVVIFNLPVPVLYAASFINGCGGGYTGLVMSVMSYLADVTLKDKLPFRLGEIFWPLDRSIWIFLYMTPFLQEPRNCTYWFLTKRLVTLLCLR